MLLFILGCEVGFILGIAGVLASLLVWERVKAGNDE